MPHTYDYSLDPKYCTLDDDDDSGNQEEEEEYQTVCGIYDEHRGERAVYQDEDETQWECTECGAEWWEETPDDMELP